MDVHCSSCGEPWDVFHLWHEAIFETGLTTEEAKVWRSLPRPEKLSERYRNEFRAVGWHFGRTVINVIRCPSCPKGAEPNMECFYAKATLEHLLGADEDALAAAFNDHQL